MSDDATTIRDMEHMADHYEQSGHANSAKLIREGIALINRLTLRWSSERPTVPGVYLVRYHKAGDFGWEAKRLTQKDLDSTFKSSVQWFRDHHFVGPLEVAEPEDTNQS